MYLREKPGRRLALKSKIAYEYSYRKEILRTEQNRIIEQAKLTLSPRSNSFNKQEKATEEQINKQNKNLLKDIGKKSNIYKIVENASTRLVINSKYILLASLY